MFSCSAAVTTKQKETVIEGIDEVVFQDLQYLLKEFRQEGRSTSPTFQIWDDFLSRVMLIRYAKVEFLPLLFATNRSIYTQKKKFSQYRHCVQ